MLYDERMFSIYNDVKSWMMIYDNFFNDNVWWMFMFTMLMLCFKCFMLWMFTITFNDVNF